MDAFQESAATWDKIASLYESAFMGLNLYDDTYDAFLDRLPPSKSRILDIGCGPGNIAAYLSRSRPEFEIEGVDLSPNMVALARKNVPRAAFQVMDGRLIHQLKPGFQGIIAGFYLPYCPHEDRYTWLTNCWHLLAPDGIFYVSFVPGDPSDSGFQTGPGGDRTYFHVHPLEDVIADLAGIGFVQLTVSTKVYQRSNGLSEEHVIVLGQKTK